MKIIKSLQNEQIKIIGRLKNKKHRLETNQFIVEGPHLVQMAIESNRLLTLIITQDEIISYKKYLEKIDTLIVSKSIINKLSFSKSPQNVMGVAMIQESSLIEGNKIIVLDNVQDPGNVGTLLRSALAFDFDQVILSSNCVDLYNDKVVRASQGAIFKIATLSEDLEDVYKQLKKQDYQIIATSLNDKSMPLNNLQTKAKFAIVLGNEGSGVSKTSLDNASVVVKIKMSSKIDSLNVGVAGSIVMYELNKEVKE